MTLSIKYGQRIILKKTWNWTRRNKNSFKSKLWKLKQPERKTAGMKEEWWTEEVTKIHLFVWLLGDMRWERKRGRGKRKEDESVLCLCQRIGEIWEKWVEIAAQLLLPIKQNIN